MHTCEKDPSTDSDETTVSNDESDSDSRKDPEQTNTASAEIGISEDDANSILGWYLASDTDTEKDPGQPDIPAEWYCRNYFVHGTQGDQMDVKLVVTTLDTQDMYQIKALLDTGCTSSSINRNFINQNLIKV